VERSDRPDDGLTRRWSSGLRARPSFAIHGIAIGIIVALAVALAVVGPIATRSAANDSFEDATLIEALPFRDEAVDVSNAEVEIDEADPMCATFERTAWYVLASDAETPLSIRVVPGEPPDADFDVALAMWIANPDGALEEVGCVDDRGINAAEQLVVALDDEETYYFQVGATDRPGTRVGDLSVLVDVQRPEHDLLAFAREVGTSPFLDTGIDTIDARREAGETNPSCADVDATTWYRLSAPDDAVLKVSAVPSAVEGNSMDIAIGVYDGQEVDSLTERACVDAAGVQASEYVEVTVESGHEYAIQVGAVLGADAWPGRFSLAIAGRQVIGAEPPPDTVLGAASLLLPVETSAGLAIDYATEGPCHVAEGRLVADGAGACTLSASQPGDADWAPAAPLVHEIEIARRAQVIELAPLPDAVVGEPLEDVNNEPQATPIIESRRTTGSRPITGSKLFFAGKVASDPPGRLVADGALVDSAFAPGSSTEDYYAIDLEPGEVLVVRGFADSWGLDIATPTDLSSEVVRWNDVRYRGGAYRWLAVEPGIHSVRARDRSRGTRPGYRYTLSFDVLPADLSALPDPGVSITDTRDLTGKIAHEPAGTLVGAGAKITSALDPGAGIRDHYAISLEQGDVLVIRTKGSRWRPQVATPAALAADVVEWSDIDRRAGAHRYVATEAGTYSVRAREVGASRRPSIPYAISFDVHPAADR
jgi:hypothetical protein